MTNKILVVHFDDGYVNHHKKGEKRDNETATVSLLDVAKASLKSSYTLSSANDENFATPLNPVDLGRKSKGTEFTWLCQNWDNGCVNTDADHAKEHWIYIYLPSELKAGNSYTLKLDNLAANNNEVTFIYDEKQLHSEAIHVNNLGYAPVAPAKYAYLYHWMGDKGALDLSAFVDKDFKIVNTETQETAFTGKIKFRKNKTSTETGQQGETPNNNFSGSDVYECDFSAYNTPGNYRVVVDGIGCSFTFQIDADAYREAYYWTMKGLYQNRSGIELLPQYTDHPRPAPHNPTLTSGFSGRLKYTTTRFMDLSTSDGATADKEKVEAGAKGTLNTWGWYQDAGDWDGYYTHSHVPSLLMFLYESGRNKFTDNELNIPESGNGIPDVLDEASWLLRYFKRTKDEIKQKGWGTGGIAGARVFGDLWGDDTRQDGTTKGSWEDTDRDWYVTGEDVWMTYKYAALASQMAYILASENLSDPEGVDWKQEAIDAYNWAIANTKSADEIIKNNIELKHIRLYAAASLYRLTNGATFHDKFKSELTSTVLEKLSEENRDLSFAAWTYLMLPANRSTDANTLTLIRNSITKLSNDILISSGSQRACRWGGNFYFPMLVGQPTTPMVTSGVYGYIANKQADPTKAEMFFSYLHTTADYFLGTNPLNITWISGVGERHPVGIFHMDWWYSGKDEVIKGVVPYGPWKVQDFGDLGPWNPNWAYKTIYPEDVNLWPGHERWFDQRVSPLTSEFTIHQNSVVSAFVYGFLTNDKEIKTIVEVPDAPLGNNKSRELGSIILYPNPISQTVQVKLTSLNSKIKNIELVSLAGESLIINRFENQGNQYTVDLPALKKGSYVIRFTTDKGEKIDRKVLVMD